MTLPRRIRMFWPLALAIGALGVLQAKACLMDVLRILEHLTIDDTFLYLQIARNVALGKGPTFDGIHLTNGFQPLWLLAVVPLGWVFREPITFLRATLFLCAALNLVTTGLLYRMGLRLAGRRLGIPLVVGWTWVVVGWKPMLLGMETSLYTTLFVAFVDRLLRHHAGRRGLGVLGGLLVLCRVDALVYMLGGCVALRPRSLRGILPFAAGGLMIAGPYFVWNQVVFDSPLPVSGRVKALYNRQELGESYLGVGHASAAFTTYLPRVGFGIARAMLTPLEFTLHRKPHRWVLWVCAAFLGGLLVMREWRFKLGMLAMSGIAHMALMCASIGRFAEATWYYAPLLVLVPLGFAMVASWVWGHLPAWARVPGAALLLGAGLVAMATGNAALDLPHEANGLYSWRFQVAQWMAQHLPEDAICGSWNAGQLGYFSNRRVVNLDGLANDQHYFVRLASGKSVLDYCRKEKIEYLVDYDAPDLSMRPGRTWDRRIAFRGVIDCRLLTLVYQIPDDGYPSDTVRVLKILPSLGRQGREGAAPGSAPAQS